MSRKRGRPGRSAPATNAGPATLEKGARSRGRSVGRTGAALVLLAVLVAYEPSLRAPFYFDDHRNIVHNPIVRELSWFARPWAVNESGANHFHLHSFKTRYVTNLSFALDYRLNGIVPRGYHATSVALHLATTLLVGLALRRALRLPAFAGSAASSEAGTIALVAAALFALHPIQTETVTYTVQRAALLAGGFSVLAFWCYLRALTGGGRTRWAWLAGCLAALALGSLSKQNAVIVPLVLLLFDLLFVPRSRRARRLSIALRSSRA